ncbi:MAG TPA: thioredoxin domain-containing protein [Parvularculaceae bacterium]|nr:thioredoxin domain-containing protein [Parvularculaceae bacterium]
MKRRAIIMAAYAVALVAAARPAPKASAPFAGEPAVIAATFSSAWCAPCRILKPRLARVIPEFKDEPVKFVDYDFTFGRNEALDEKAAADGLRPLFQAYSKATGFTLLVDADTGALIGMLTADDSKRQMREAIDDALAVALARTL